MEDDEKDDGAQVAGAATVRGSRRLSNQSGALPCFPYDFKKSLDSTASKGGRSAFFKVTPTAGHSNQKQAIAAQS